MIQNPKPQRGIQGYFYNRQIKRYIGVFMAVFAGLQVETGRRDDGETRVLSVPVVYGSKDRVVAGILASNTQNKPIRLPTMSVYLRNLELDQSRMKGSGYVRNTPHVPEGALLPDGVVNLKQRMPVPYNLDLELSIYTSNMEQHMQIVEQIIMMFDPSIQIERSDAVYDWAKNVMIELRSIDFDENYPAGTERRKIQTNMRFHMPIWIETPAEYRDDLIKSIHLRIQAINDMAEFFESIAIAEDSDYEVIADAEDVREDVLGSGA